jgi:phage/plasmid-like protein (TIGR03299 family)
MAHMIESVNGKAQMAYAGDVPWHGLGTKVPNDLTPTQMLEAAGLNWSVEKVPAYAKVGGKNVAIGQSALVRSFDEKILDVVSDDWNPVQNEEAFDFFNDFVAAGDMEMHTAGSLRDGQIVWGLAKIKESFELFKGDQIDSYLLFSNFHKYGYSTDVRFTPIRVVCNNTLTLSLNSKVERMAKISHRKVFDPVSVKDMLGIATDKLAKYKDMAKFLGSKKAKDEDIVEYFCRVFPVSGSNENKKKEVSKNAQTALDILHTQPGSEFAEGSWWQPFNAVTYLTDHLAGRSADTRLTSAWYGYNKGVKTKALELALEMAEAV